MAESGNIRLEIVTPRGVALRTEVRELAAPSVAGKFGVLPGHLPLLAALEVGLVQYTPAGSEERESVAVGAGFVEILRDGALLLTDRFMAQKEVDVLAVRERLHEVDEELGRWEGELRDPHRLELVEEEQWLAAQLELYGDPPVPRLLEHVRTVDYSGVIPGEPEPGEPDVPPPEAP
ncbi:MAG: ATP synthase F1 subunit epsilon [Deltaproteobacteria bacterium]|nr:ATP synthase F1 subunit epsilon [Deltaproteobacteria bacterium]